MKLILVLLAICLLVPTVAAAWEPIVGDIKCTADTTLSFTTGLNANGPKVIDFALDGKAAIKFVWFKDNNTARNAGAISRTLTLLLRDYTPPRGMGFASGPDSAVVDLVTATEVIVTR